MTGASNRRKGHTAERAVARYLQDHGYPDARTTRAELGHDGTHTPGDVIGPVGLVIEVKDVEASAWPTWCRQAEQEANGRPWVVVRKLRGPGGGNVGNWICRWRQPGGLIACASFATFLREFDDTFYESAS